jgi:hypothetical protein
VIVINAIRLWFNRDHDTAVDLPAGDVTSDHWKCAGGRYFSALLTIVLTTVTLAGALVLFIIF